MPGLSISDQLNKSLQIALEKRCRADLKKKADFWANTIPEKMNHMIDQIEGWGLGTISKVGWAVGYKTSKDLSGTFVFLNKTEAEVLDLIQTATPAPDKIPVKGLALERMVARRIVILKETIDGMYETEKQFATFRTNTSINQNHAAHYPPLKGDIRLGELQTKQDLVDLVSLMAQNPNHVAWTNKKDFDEIQTFLNHPNLDDDTVAKGYAAATVMLVTKE